MKKGKATNALPFALNLLFFAKQRSIIRYPSQIIFHIAVQHQLGIGEGIVVDQIIQLRLFVHVPDDLILHSDAVN